MIIGEVMLKYLEVSGTDYEMGFQIGEFLKTYKKKNS